jgi:hypothetical protein
MCVELIVFSGSPSVFDLWKSGEVSNATFVGKNDPGKDNRDTLVRQRVLSRSRRDLVRGDKPPNECHVNYRQHDSIPHPHPSPDSSSATLVLHRGITSGVEWGGWFLGLPKVCPSKVLH